jgi:CheY-like chemotaxis protein
VYDLRLMSARGRIVFASYFAATLAVGVAVVSLVALGLSPLGLAVAVGAGVMTGVLAARSLGRWKLAPLNDRMRARQRTLVLRGETGRVGLVPERASVDRHLDALLGQIDVVVGDRDALQQRVEELRNLIENTTERQQQSEASLRDEVASAASHMQLQSLQMQLVGAAIRCELATTELVVRNISVGGRIDAAGGEVAALAGEALDRARRLSTWASWANRSSTDCDGTASSHRVHADLISLARAAAYRHDRDILVHGTGRGPGVGVTSEEILTVVIDLLLEHLVQVTPKLAPLCMDLGFELQDPLPCALVTVRPTPGIGPEGVTADSLNAGPAIADWLARRGDGSSLEARGDAWLLRIPVATLGRDSDSQLGHAHVLQQRSVMVVDPLGARRGALCEVLAARQLHPTAVATVSEALERYADSARAGRSFDTIFVVPDATPNLPNGDIWSTTALDELLSRPEIPATTRIIALSHVSTLTGHLHGGGTHVRARTVTRPTSVARLLEVLTVRHDQNRAQPRPDRSEGPRPTHVLIAEDNAVTQLHLGKLLEQRGITSVTVSNGAEAVDRFLSDGPGAYAAVLMDIQMPVMDGYEATQVIRAREARDGLPRIPIIAVTAHAMASERQRCLQTGMNEHVTKPIVPETLFGVLGRLTGRHFPLPPPPLAPPTVAAPAASASSTSATANTAMPPPAVATIPASPAAAAPNPPAPAERRFNREHLLDFAGGDVAFVRKLTEIFGRTAPKQADDLRLAHEAGDVEKVRFIAHQLKGAVGNFGAESAHRLAARIEQAAKAGQRDGLSEDIAELAADIGWIHEELKRLSDELGA